MLSDSDVFTLGCGLGRKWRDHVEPEDLHCIREHQKELRKDFLTWQSLYYIIHPEHTGNETKAREFWDGVFQVDPDSRRHVKGLHFVRGFLEGVLEAT